jgi:hypothetical protein
MWSLERFDELAQIGMNAFCGRHDPYGDLPLATALPEGQPTVGC